MSAGDPPDGQLLEPAGDSPLDFRSALSQHTPRVWVTPTMLGLNVAVFLLMVVAGGVSPMNPTSENLLRWGADFGPYVTGGQPWRLLTNTFIHVGALHLIMNMIGLWQIGLLVERLLGNAGFIVTYLLAGLCGSLLSMVAHPFTVSAGASGAIFGIYGALIAYLLRHRGSVPKMALAALQKTAITFVAFNVIYGLRAKGIDMAAHMGGLVGGAAAGVAVASPLRDPSTRRLAVAARTGIVGLGIIALGLACLPKMADLSAEIEALQPVEARAIATYNDALKKAARHEIADEELGRIIEERVLPPWRGFQRRFAHRARVAPQQRALADELTRYVAAREEAWTKIARGLAAHNQADVDTANEKLQRTLDSLTILGTEDKPTTGSSSGDRLPHRTPTSP